MIISHKDEMENGIFFPAIIHVGTTFYTMHFWQITCQMVKISLLNIQSFIPFMCFSNKVSFVCSLKLS